MTQELKGRIRAAQLGDKALMEELLRENTPLVWSVAKRFYGRGCEPEDLFQLGAIGLIKAVRDFDLTQEVAFSTYAVPKIAGEIRRFLRDDGSVKVSRGMKERANTIRLARDKLGHDLGREPTVQELSELTGLDPEDIAAADLASLSVASLQEESGEDGFSLEDVLGSVGMEEELVERFSLHEAIRSLPEREQMVIRLRYYKNLTQERCSHIMGVSQVQVSRIERKDTAHLKEILTNSF